MGLFSRSSHTHFERNQAGKVTGVFRDTNSLEDEYRSRHPTAWSKLKAGVKQNIHDFNTQKRAERKAYKESYNEARIRRMRVEGRNRAFGRPGWKTGGNVPRKHKSKPRVSYAVVNGRAYPIYSQSHKKQKQHGKQSFASAWSDPFKVPDYSKRRYW